MRLKATYLMVNEEVFDSMMFAEDEDLIGEEVTAIEESGGSERLDIDKVWDTLHCFVTKASVEEPVTHTKLGKAIVGNHTFMVYEDVDFITGIEHSELPDIISALEQADFEKLSADFKIRTYKNKKIYPCGIQFDDREQLLNEFRVTLNELLEFYRKAFNTNHHVVISRQEI